MVRLLSRVLQSVHLCSSEPSSLHVTGLVVTHLPALCGFVGRSRFWRENPHIVHCSSSVPVDVQLASFVVFHAPESCVVIGSVLDSNTAEQTVHRISSFPSVVQVGAAVTDQLPRVCSISGNSSFFISEQEEHLYSCTPFVLQVEGVSFPFSQEWSVTVTLILSTTLPSVT